MSIRPPRATELLAAAALVFVLSTTARARADGPTSIAEQLFLEGRALMQAEEYEKACEKFKASYALDRSAYGTLLNLALCHEATNKLATAWAEFRVVAAASEGRRADRVALAREREATLFPKLSYLKIVVPEAARAPGLTIRIDGTPIEDSVWDTEVCLDPGPHVVDVSAPGKTSQRSELTIGAEADHQAITVAPLRDAPSPRPPVAVDQGGRARTILGYALGGTGVAAAGVGLVFGLVASNQRDEARSLCDPDRVCPSQERRDDAARIYSSARSSSHASTALVGVGAALIVSGVVLVLTSRSTSAKPSASSSFVVAPIASGGAALWQGAF